MIFLKEDLHDKPTPFTKCFNYNGDHGNKHIPMFVLWPIVQVFRLHCVMFGDLFYRLRYINDVLDYEQHSDVENNYIRMT